MSGIILPWPDKALSPNARVNFWVRSKAAKKAREDAHKATIDAKCVVPDTETIRLHLTFYPPTNQKRDDDNFIARFKPFRDGIADALGVDDSRFRTSAEFGDVIKGGRVVARVEAI